MPYFNPDWGVVYIDDEIEREREERERLDRKEEEDEEDEEDESDFYSTPIISIEESFLSPEQIREEYGEIIPYEYDEEDD